MCVGVEDGNQSAGEVPTAQSRALMSKPEPLMVKPGLEIAIFGKCGYHARSEAQPKAGESDAIHRPGCAEP